MSKIVNKKGFTLIELLVVVLIIGVLSGIALPQYRRSVERTRVAESLTLLRAIYDSCERLAWERNYKGCFDRSMPSTLMTFPKLDVMVKGTYENAGKTLNTSNFSYTIVNSNAGQYIQATAKGDYTGAVIQFNGNMFHCINGTVGEAVKACSYWASDTWNQGINGEWDAGGGSFGDDDDDGNWD